MNPLLKPFALRKPIKKAKSPRTKIRRRTKSRSKDEAIYRKRVKDRLEGEYCDFLTCYQLAAEVHHKFGRKNKLLLWEQGWILLCSRHHTFVHNNPDSARKMGLLCEVGQFNNQKLVK